MKIKENKYLLLTLFIWTILIGSLLIFEFNRTKRETYIDAKIEANTNFNKDQALRFWSSLHGGVYVPIDSITQPNPALSHIPEYIIETPSGKKLTLMNPAYMIRQLNEYFERDYGIVGHITSKKLIREENKPDAWELDALNQFEKGVTEVSGYSIIEDAQYFRLMKPMIINESCLKCHGYQGYKVGDIRGGVAVSVPMSHLLDKAQEQKTSLTFIFFLIWLAGFWGIILGFRSINKSIEKQRIIENKLKEQENLKEQIATKEKIFSIIAHDLRSPFNSLLGFSQLLNAEIPNNNMGLIDKYAHIINMNLKKSMTLLDNLLDWSLLHTDKIFFNPEIINFTELSNNVIDYLNIVAGKKRNNHYIFN